MSRKQLAALVTIAAISTPSLPVAAQVAQVGELATVDIAVGEGRHLAFPDVARLPDGRLIVVYREGDGHVDAAGRIVRQFGSPDGTEWSFPEPIVDTPGIDDRDPSIAVLSDGSLLLTFFQYADHTVEGERLILHHVFAARSNDGGETFGSVVQVDPGPMAADDVSGPDETGWLDNEGQRIRVMGVSSPVVLVGEDLVLPTYGGDAVRLSDLDSAPRARIVVWRSRDGGVSWRDEVVNPELWPDGWLMEPAVIALSSGRTLMHIRTAQTASPGGPGPMAQAVSDDGGHHFGDWAPFDFIGHAPDLLELSTGEVLSAFRWVDDAYETASVGVVVSGDHGESWTAPVLVEACGEAECGYPSMVEAENGRILIVYYADGGNAIRAKILLLGG